MEDRNECVNNALSFLENATDRTGKCVEKLFGRTVREDLDRMAEISVDLEERLNKGHSLPIDLVSEYNILSTEHFPKENRMASDEKMLCVLPQLGKWIPVAERLPECEQEVLICTEKKIVGKDAYIDSIITPAIYENGTMPECDSIWHWEDIDYADWNEENDCGIIPEGWWENRHFNPDEVYNNPVDRKVVAWMPLPEPPKEERA